MALCNAANEVAVEAFLGEKIRFTQIPRVIESVLEQIAVIEPNSLAVVEAADTEARLIAREAVANILQAGGGA